MLFHISFLMSSTGAQLPLLRFEANSGAPLDITESIPDFPSLADSSNSNSLVRNLRNSPDCESKPDGGNCRSYFIKYYFDKNSGTCKDFVYGGCDGNGNRYDSAKECEKQCGNTETCVDIARTGECQQYKNEGYCNYEWMQENCKATCGLCSSKSYSSKSYSVEDTCNGNGVHAITSLNDCRNASESLNFTDNEVIEQAYRSEQFPKGCVWLNFGGADGIRVIYNPNGHNGASAHKDKARVICEKRQ